MTAPAVWIVDKPGMYPIAMSSFFASIISCIIPISPIMQIPIIRIITTVWIIVNPMVDTEFFRLFDEKKNSHRPERINRTKTNSAMPIINAVKSICAFHVNANDCRVDSVKIINTEANGELTSWLKSAIPSKSAMNVYNTTAARNSDEEPAAFTARTAESAPESGG